MNIQLLKVAKFYRRLYGGGRKLAPPLPPFPQHHRTNVWGAISSLAKDLSLSSLAVFVNFKVLFSFLVFFSL